MKSAEDIISRLAFVKPKQHTMSRVGIWVAGGAKDAMAKALELYERRATTEGWERAKKFTKMTGAWREIPQQEARRCVGVSV